MIKNILTLIFCVTFFSASTAQASIEIGDKAPVFKSFDTFSKPITLNSFMGKIVVLEWTNHGCPFVDKQYSGGNMQKIQSKLKGEDLVWVSIVSSAPGKQGYVEPPEANAITIENKATITHKILDPTGEIGRLYGAVTTPHMFVINKEGGLAYQGAIDDHKTWRQRGLEDATNYVENAVSDLRAGKSVKISETQPYGCAIKY